MNIRKTTFADLNSLLEIYATAREFMAKNGNPNQWGSAWPPQEQIKEDIRQGYSYVCECEGQIAGTFFFNAGKDIEPTYRLITEGKWGNDTPYGVIHRLASNGKAKGIGAFCIQWCYEQCGHLRVDTHPDNRPMQHLLHKLGFAYRGIIHVKHDPMPRLAFEK